MLLRRVYLRIRLFFSSHKRDINKTIVILMVTVLFYMFFNSFIMRGFIINKAKENQAKRQFNSALFLYNLSYPYYKINHFSLENKRIYLELPQKISTSYFSNNNKASAQINIIKAKKAIQKEYGFYSKEMADFLRKTEIEYLLLDNNISSAQKEFKNLLTIYKKIGYSQDIMVDLIRLNGDIFQKKGNLNASQSLYEKGYNMITTEKNPDYEILSTINERLADLHIKKGNSGEALKIYEEAIDTLQDTNQKEALAQAYLNVAYLYNKKEITKKAIQNYEKSIEIIKTLPRTSSLNQNLNQYYLEIRELYTKTGQSFKVAEVDVEISKRKQFSFFY